jgi:hypothetical protein
MPVQNIINNFMNNFFIFYSIFTTIVIIAGVSFYFSKIKEANDYIKQLQDERTGKVEYEVLKQRKGD